MRDKGPSRRDFVKGVAATSAGLVLVGCGSSGSGDDGDDAPDAGSGADAAGVVTPPETTPEVDRFGLGVSAGDVAAERAVVWTRYDGAAVLAAVVWRMDGDRYVDERGPFPATPAEGGFVHVAIEDLVRGARYRYAFFELDGDDRTGRSPIGRFRAAIADDAMEPLTFGAISCCSVRDRDSVVIGRAAERDDLDAFLFVGDNAYCDADNLAKYRADYVVHFGTPEHIALRARNGMYITWDDHEVANDWNPETANDARVSAAFQCFFDHAPVARVAGTETRIWRSARWGRTAEVFVLDSRSERRPSTILSGNPEYISPAQRAWLEAGLLASPAVFKIIVNSVPITNMPTLWDAYPTDRWEGYGAQRTAVLQFIDDNAIDGVIWVAGDFHLAFISRVSPSGAGANQREVLVGPGAQNANPLLATLQPPQFSFATGTNNYTTLALDPVGRSVTVSYFDASGAMFHSESFVP